MSELNDLRVANIEEYAKSYNDMTDEKAEELAQKGQQLSIPSETLLEVRLQQPAPLPVTK